MANTFIIVIVSDSISAFLFSVNYCLFIMVLISRKSLVKTAVADAATLLPCFARVLLQCKCPAAMPSSAIVQQPQAEFLMTILNLLSYELRKTSVCGMSGTF